MRKGQIASIDLFIALSVFIILIIASLHIWNLYNLRMQEDIEYDNLKLRGFQITDLVVKSPGFPTAWEEDVGSLEVIGLAADDRILSQSKIDAFVALDYNTAREKFNIGLYDYKFKIKDLANNPLYESGYNFTGDVSVVIERYVMVDDEKKIMEFTLWK